MKKMAGMTMKSAVRSVSALALSLTVLLGASLSVRADEADAKRILKGMSDYLVAQKAIAFEYDATLEIVTEDAQILALASSGTVVLNRPNRIRATHVGGFANVEMFFDGNTLTVLGKNLNVYAQAAAPGTIAQLIDDLTVKHNKPLPASDVLLSNPYDALMSDVYDIKDLGSGVVGGVECDHLAFRAKEVDWQIWIAQGQRPYPCRYAIASKTIAGEPQYIVQTRNWRTGDQVAATDFSFKNNTKAEKVDLQSVASPDDLPGHFVTGESK